MSENVLKKIDSLNVCLEEKLNVDPYQMDGAVMRYLEKKKTGLIRRLVSTYQSDRQIDMRRFFDKEGISCQHAAGDVLLALVE